jgi:endonuclease-8
VPVEEALLNQRRMAGIGNVLKSEALFVARVDPYAPVSALDAATLEELVRVSQRLLRENVAGVERPVVARRSAARGTTRSADPAAQLYVYDRAGRRCRRCGTTIEYRRAGLHARATYWCPKCQVRGRVPRNHDVREEHDEHEGD